MLGSQRLRVKSMVPRSSVPALSVDLRARASLLLLPISPRLWYLTSSLARSRQTSWACSRRMFSSTSNTRRIQSIYARPKAGAIGRIWSSMPQPIKSFAYLTLGTAITVIVAPALLILVLPPLLVGAFYTRRMLRNAQGALSTQRWSNPGSYFRTESAIPQNSRSIPYPAKSLIYDALVSNEQGLAEMLRVNTDALSYTPLEKLGKEVRAGPNGSTSSLQIMEFGLLSSNSRVATASVLERVQNNQAEMRVEITPARSWKSYVLSPHESNTTIIDVDKKKKSSAPW